MLYIIDGTRVDDVRIYDDEITPCLKSRMGTGGNNVPFIAQETDMTDPTLSFDTQFGSNAIVFEGVAPTMKASQQSPSVAYDEPMAFSHYSSDPSAGDVSPTMRSGTNVSGHAVNIGMVVRRLTPTECTRLMGWRDDHLEIGTLHAPDQDYARQVVRHLWRGLQPYENQRQTRGFWSVLTPEILLAAVRLGWISWNVAGECATRAREVQGEDSWPEAFMRRLRENAEHRPSPHRREPFEQLAGELGRPLPFMSFEATSETKGLFYLGLYEQAQGTGFLQQALDSMEKMGRPFVYQERVKELSDTTRYKMCGNGVASPVAQWIGEQLMKIEHES